MVLDIGEITSLLFLVILSFISHKLKMTTLSGTISGIILGLVIILFGSWKWFIVFILFFLIGSAATKFRLSEKITKGVIEEKKGARNWKNAVSNALPAAIAALLFHTHPHVSIFFSSSISSALADTLATEIGVLSRREPRLILDLRKKVDVGYSGGVTLEGYIAAFAGSIIISSSSSILGISNAGYKGFLAITVAGLLGCTVDSLVGATLQARYKCSICGKVTESPNHCGERATLIGGFKWLGNHATNLIANLIAGALGLSIFYGI